MATLADGISRLLSGVPDWQATLLLLVASLVGALLVEFVGVRAAGRVAGRTESQFDNIAVQEVRWPVVVTVGLAGFWLISSLPETASFLAEDTLDRFFGKPSLTVIVLVWARGLNRMVNRFVAEVEDSGHYEFAPVFSNVFTLVMVVGAAFVTLYIWNVEVTPLLGAAGIAGIAVGFAAKDTVANFFGGMALYFDDTYKLGDFIVLDDGQSGTVVKIGVRSTTIMTRDEVLVTVPNSVLNNATIVNHSAPDRRKRVRVPLGVAYGTDLDEFEELVLGIAADEDRVLGDPSPRMRLRRFGDSALEYELLCWVRSPGQEKKTIHRLNRTIYRRLGEAGIEIPYPQRDVSVRGGRFPGSGAPGVEDADDQFPPEEPNILDADGGADGNE